MSRGVWAASLFSAGLATIITAKYVEKIMLDEVDKQVQEQVEASVEFMTMRLDAELISKAGNEGEDISEEELEETHTRVFGTRYAQKPPIDQVAGRNERLRYDQILTKGEYKSSPETTKEDLHAVAVEDDVQEPGRADLSELVVLPKDEFMENESGYMQMTLMYFSDGGVLDEANDLVPDWQDMIGKGMPPFGELSGEPHIVYLRNNKHRQEYEVVYDQGKAADILADPTESP